MGDVGWLMDEGGPPWWQISSRVQEVQGFKSLGARVERRGAYIKKYRTMESTLEMRIGPVVIGYAL